MKNMNNFYSGKAISIEPDLDKTDNYLDNTQAHMTPHTLPDKLPRISHALSNPSSMSMPVRK